MLSRVLCISYACITFRKIGMLFERGDCKEYGQACLVHLMCVEIFHLPEIRRIAIGIKSLWIPQNNSLVSLNNYNQS